MSIFTPIEIYHPIPLVMDVDSLPFAKLGL